MAVLKAADILKARDIKEPVPFEVPAWGGTVLIRQLSAGERDRWERSLIKKGSIESKHLRASLIALCLVDETGARLFGSVQDVISLSGHAASVLDPIVDKCRELNGMSKSDLEELENFSDATAEPALPTS